MRPPLFDFQLRALNQIQPWGAPEDPYLHWFGLTDGFYWMNVGEQTLLEYSQQVQSQPGATRYCNYQVALVHEDLLDMVPHVLAPVPQELQPFISLHSRDSYWEAWTSLDDALLFGNPNLDLLGDAGSWMGARTLDSLYLSPSARIWMWSDTQDVHIQWDNRDKQWNGSPAWSAQIGSFSLSRADFVNEVSAFHGRFMHLMANRVASIQALGAPPDVRIDLAALEQDQHRREQLLEASLQEPIDAMPWSTVVKAVRQLEHYRKARANWSNWRWTSRRERCLSRFDLVDAPIG